MPRIGFHSNRESLAADIFSLVQEPAVFSFPHPIAFIFSPATHSNVSGQAKLMHHLTIYWGCALDNLPTSIR